jgi:hypothetical protein
MDEHKVQDILLQLLSDMAYVKAKLDNIDETIFHLLEGDESCISSENFWHAKHINLSLNRMQY